ncbi:hypothetical protein GCM10010399_25490 [Dactylosporangium fulvum]|uniref:PadR family transcriptional regulator n=1 Tax=Dactylosporangium fulvum TaxID=53359 RepID=A0ABY5WBQ5_9ACTN|nr:PadR family transcriptional regulator [Dactylosporangium fulvum]UWP86967.1 PadR family transcriptional regulator [Dactylosporangium fulvum]
MGELPALSLADWIVLAVVDEEPTHGFAIAALTTEHGDLGRIWHVPRPIVYRSLDRLTGLGLIRVEATEAGSRGPQRSVLTTTPAGNAAVIAWLHQPVGHVRDMRSALLAKLALLARRRLDSTDLLAAQRDVLTPVHEALERQQADATGFGRVLLAWRLENVGAALRFIDTVAG